MRSCAWKSFRRIKKDRVGEPVNAIEGIDAHRAYAAGYANLHREMVYGSAPDFAMAVGTLMRLAEHHRKGRS